MRLTLPFAGPEHLQASGVDHHVHWISCCSYCLGDGQVDAAARKGGVIGDREINVKQTQDRGQHAFGLAPGPTKCQPQHQASFDDHLGVPPWSTTPARVCRGPRVKRLSRHPHRQVAAPTQCRIIVAPILYTVASLWNPAAALLIDLVGKAALGFREAPLYLTLALARYLRPNYAPTSRWWFSSSSTWSW